MRKYTNAIHTNLTDEEFLALRKRLLEERTSLSEFFGRCARNHLGVKKPSRIPRATEEVAETA